LIGPIFHLTKGAIQRHYARAIYQRPEIKDCLSLLTANETDWMQAKAYERFCIHEPITDDELLDEIEIEAGKFILPDTLRKTIARPLVSHCPRNSKRGNACAL
jgi:hypothetical protein